MLATLRRWLRRVLRRPRPSPRHGSGERLYDQERDGGA